MTNTDTKVEAVNPAPSIPPTDDGKGNVAKIIIGTFALILFVGSLITIYKVLNPELLKVTPGPAQTGPSTVPTSGTASTSASVTPTTNDYTGWKEYSNDDLKLSFKAPADYTVTNKTDNFAQIDCVPDSNPYQSTLGSYTYHEIYHGSKKILELKIYFDSTPLGTPAYCSLYGYPELVPDDPNIKPCVEHKSSKFPDFIVYQDPNPFDQKQFSTNRIQLSTNSRMYKADTMCSMGTFAFMYAEGPKPESLDYSKYFTQDEIDNAALIFKSITNTD